jgi:alkylation response protein AidB-like acyl-CoA dehydrogenase
VFEASIHLPHAAAVRAEIRAFLAATPFTPHINCWAHPSEPFSAALGAAGFLGLTWPAPHGHARHPIERLIVLEELLAAGAPVGAHWIADRQSGPLLLRYGTQAQQARWLPAIAAGTAFTCIGLSEPGAGSDLAAVRARATRTATGWVLSGQKLWTSGAARAHLMIGLFRSTPGSERHAGLSQFLIPMDTPGITVRPIQDITGAADFNEVFLDDVHLPRRRAARRRGRRLAPGHRRAGARTLRPRALPFRLAAGHGPRPRPRTPDAAALLGTLVAEAFTLRRLSWACAPRWRRAATPPPRPRS